MSSDNPKHNDNPKFTDGSEAQGDDSKPTVSVQVATAIDTTLTYALGENLADCPVGSIVRVPVGKRRHIGAVWRQKASTEVVSLSAKTGADQLTEPSKPTYQLREVLEIISRGALSPQFMAWIDWMSTYLFAPRGVVLSHCLREAWMRSMCSTQQVVQWNGETPKRLTAGRRAVIEEFAQRANNAQIPLSELVTLPNVTRSVIDSMTSNGYLASTRLVMPEPVTTAPQHDFRQPCLAPDQLRVASSIGDLIEANDYAVFVLDGVTGSGKTVVYFDAIARVLRKGGQALILLPEIVLTPKFAESFASRFGVEPAMWHAGVGDSAKGKIWRGAVSGNIKVVVGARSALFLPFRDLQLIVVDEEHDAAYKQDVGINYNARDMAIARAKSEVAVIVLASATPSLETHRNIEIGKYKVGRLESRFGSAKLPGVKLIDIRDNPPDAGRWIGGELTEALAHTLSVGKQVLLFLNRRGYAPLVLCRGCGVRLTCNACDSWMSEHHLGGRMRLMCHYCNANVPLPEQCPKCEGKGTLSAVGPGVERLYDEVKLLHPQASIMIVSSDTMRNAGDMNLAINRITDGLVDVIIGTQMVAKGHNFPDLALVGVVDGDYALSHMDLRAAERCFQLLVQVSGRAGRGDAEGKALLQTVQPEHQLMQAIADSDRDRFVEYELEQRKSANLPPFSRMIAVIVSHGDADHVDSFVRAAAAVAPIHEHVRLYGPVPAPVARIKHQYRWRFLVQGNSSLVLQKYIRQWLRAMPKLSRNIRLRVDVDPLSFY